MSDTDESRKVEPDSFCKSGSEHGHQVALFAAAGIGALKVPELCWLHAVPNGGSRGGDKRSATIAGANMKAEGVRSGVSDVALDVARHGYHGLKIEMKKPGGTESLEQLEYAEFITDQGYCYALADHWAKAWLVIAWYLGFHPTEFGFYVPDCPGALPFERSRLIALREKAQKAKK